MRRNLSEDAKGCETGGDEGGEEVGWCGERGGRQMEPSFAESTPVDVTFHSLLRLQTFASTNTILSSELSGLIYF